MTTALVPITDMERMALAFSKSGMFGAKTPDQALALLLLAQAEGQHPAIAMRDFDVIQGRPAKKAEAMLRSFLAAGGKVEWHQYDDNGAAATFSHPQGGSVRVDWDAARAKKAGLTGKDNYQKYARAMYRSRVISEGCKTVYPAATSGLYVPEEVRQIVREEKNMGKADVVPPEPDESQAIGTKISGAQIDALDALIKEHGIKYDDVIAKAEVNTLADIAPEDYEGACKWVKLQGAKKKATKPADATADI